jgi:catechol 2,3-dioxygenase-like lactoylglutathione lyase family enzyme
MIDHTGIGVADVGRSAAFYDATLAALGMRRVMQIPDQVGTDGIGYGFDHPVYWNDRFHPHSVRQHIAFATRTGAEIECGLHRLRRGARFRQGHGLAHATGRIV